MSYDRGLELQNHWGTVIVVIGESPYYTVNSEHKIVEYWRFEVTKTGDGLVQPGTILHLSEADCIKQGFKPHKKYGTKLWKVMNG